MKSGTVAIIQARMASSRLPGKVLMDIEGLPMLAHVVRRTRQAGEIQDLIVATTTDPADDAIVAYCRGAGIPWMRGSHFDVLDRYIQAARAVRAEIVVRITADCPLIDASLVDDTVLALRGRDAARLPATAVKDTPTEFDLAANRLPPPWARTYPIGLDTEVCTMAALERAWREAREPMDREHVMPFLYSGVQLTRRTSQLSTGISPRGFRVALWSHTTDLGSLRWTVDTPADLEFVRQVFSHLGGEGGFSWLEVLELLAAHPELVAINAGVSHKALWEVDDRAGGAEA